ncbi:MAG: hypothetical protein RIE08_06055 [Acidimicrobiales bacterium]
MVRNRAPRTWDDGFDRPPWSPLAFTVAVLAVCVVLVGVLIWWWLPDLPGSGRTRFVNETDVTISLREYNSFGDGPTEQQTLAPGIEIEWNCRAEYGLELVRPDGSTVLVPDSWCSQSRVDIGPCWTEHVEEGAQPCRGEQ